MPKSTSQTLITNWTKSPMPKKYYNLKNILYKLKNTVYNNKSINWLKNFNNSKLLNTKTKKVFTN